MSPSTAKRLAVASIVLITVCSGSFLIYRNEANQKSFRQNSTIEDDSAKIDGTESNLSEQQSTASQDNRERAANSSQASEEQTQYTGPISAGSYSPIDYSQSGGCGPNASQLNATIPYGVAFYRDGQLKSSVEIETNIPITKVSYGAYDISRFRLSQETGTSLNNWLSVEYIADPGVDSSGSVAIPITVYSSCGGSRSLSLNVSWNMSSPNSGPPSGLSDPIQ